MKNMALFRRIVAASPFALLAACATSGAMHDEGHHHGHSHDSPAACDASRAQGFIGQRASEELGRAVIAASGARELRWGPPGAAMTMDFREDRVNVFYDAGMIVERITCG